MRKWFFVMVLACSVPVFAETLLVEDFLYPVSARIDTCGGWYLPYGGASQFVTTNGLSFAGYAGSDTGNGVLLDARSGGNDLPHLHLNRVVTEGDVYVAFLFQPAVVNKKGYFFMLRDEIAANTYNFMGRLFLNENYQVGLTFGDNQKAVFSDEELDYQTTYLMVLRYTIVEGSNNDQVSLYVFSGMPSEEPQVATIGPLSDANKPDISPANVVLRGYDADGWIVIDGICVATTWEEATRTLHTNTQNVTASPSGVTKYIQDGELIIEYCGNKYSVTGARK